MEFESRVNAQLTAALNEAGKSEEIVYLRIIVSLLWLEVGQRVQS